MSGGKGESDRSRAEVLSDDLRLYEINLINTNGDNTWFIILS
jgi:hypothetical protein